MSFKSEFGNFTEKLRDKNVMIFSDSEGYIPTGIIEKITSHLEKKDDNVVVFNGDGADYTSRMLDTTKPDRFFFLKLLKMVNDNPNFLATLGNRDLNKMILWQLVQRKDEPKWWKSEDESTIDIPKILEIAKKLYDNPPEWLVENLESFFPYWSATNEDIKTWKGWGSRKDPRKYPFSLYDRYLAVFGRDPAIGSMSAENNIQGLFAELGITDDQLKNVNADFTVNNVTKVGTYINFGAALVFTVYARILDNALAANPKWEYDGCLFKFLTTNPLVGYATTSSTVYLFSHSGVHSSFNTSLIETMAQKYDDFGNKLFSGSVTQIMDKANGRVKIGGSIVSVENISDFNSKVIKYIKDYYADIEKEPQNIQNKFLKVLNGLACPIGKHAAFKDKDFHLQSPIMAGMQAMLQDREKLFTGEIRAIVNIFGHSALGAGNLFAKTKTQTLVCTDFANTFINASAMNPKDKYDANTLTLHLDMKDGQFKLDGEMYLQKLKKATSYNQQLEAPNPKDTSKKDYFNGIFIDGVVGSEDSEDMTSNFYRIIFDKKDPIDLSITYQQPPTPTVYYNGMGTIEGLITGKTPRINLFSTEANRSKGFSFNVIITPAPALMGGYKKSRKMNKTKKVKKSKAKSKLMKKSRKNKK